MASGLIDLGMSRDAFFAQCFERAPHLSAAGLRCPLPDWRDLDATLHHIPTDDQAVQLFLDGFIAREYYASQRREQGQTHWVIDRHRFFALLHQGATLVLNRFEQYSLLTRHLCDEIGRFTGISTSCNSYVSWAGPNPNLSSFGKHWDTHDVVIVQLTGQKHWRIYPPTLPLPLSQQTSRTSGMSCPAAPYRELVLQAGDVLYVPRGWWHEVTPMNTGSWHLSIGLYTPTYADYVSWICQQTLAALPAARAGAIAAPDADTTLGIVQALQQALDQPTSFTAFLRQQQAAQQPHGDFNLTLFMAGPEQADQVRVTRARAAPLDTRAAELATPTGALRLDALQREVLSLLNQHDSLSLLELMQHLPRHTRQSVRDTVLQLAVLEVLTLTQSG